LVENSTSKARDSAVSIQKVKKMIQANKLKICK
jgi:hypothetical protein